MGPCNTKHKLDLYDDTLELFTLDKKILDAKIVRVYDGDTYFAVFILNNKPVKFKIRIRKISSKYNHTIRMW